MRRGPKCGFMYMFGEYGTKACSMEDAEYRNAAFCGFGFFQPDQQVIPPSQSRIKPRALYETGPHVVEREICGPQSNCAEVVEVRSTRGRLVDGHEVVRGRISDSRNGFNTFNGNFSKLLVYTCST